MKKTIFPYKVFWIAAPLSIIIGVSLIGYHFSLFYDLISELQPILPLVLILIFLFMILGGIGMILVSSPISISDESISVGWLFKKRHSWNDFSEIILVNRNITYYYLVSDGTDVFRNLIKTADPTDILLWYYISRWSALKPLQCIMRSHLYLDYNIRVCQTDLPEVLVVIPSRNDFTSWLRTKVFE